MKIIKMIALAAGPDGTMYPGKIYPVDGKTAMALVAGGYAVYVGVPTLETATKPEEPENAVKDKTTRKRR